MLALNTTALAQDTAEFEYAQQSTEEVILEGTREVTLYRTEYVDSTCTREEPYQINVCADETRYRNECTWIPARNICNTVNDRQCRDVRRTRSECKPGRTRRVCKDEPARRVCRTRNGVERCVDIPGRQNCRDVTGPQVCRDVSYTDRVCQSVPRRVCHNEPGRNVCRNIPYQDHVCRDVTRYRSISYACKEPVQVPYVVNKEFKYQVNFSFNDVDQLGRAAIKLAMDKDGQINISYKDLSESETYLQLISEDQTVLVDTDEEAHIVKNISINFGNLKKLLAPLNATQKSLWMNKGGDFKLKVNDPDNLAGSEIKVSVTKRSSGDLHFAKVFKLSDFDVSNTHLSADLATHGFEQLRGFLGFKVKLKVDISVKVEKPKNLLVPLNLEFEKSKSFNLKVKKN
jgi:hypothetical protein